MKSAPFPDNEEVRIRLLTELDILDTLEEQAYDDLTYIAAQICNVPIALVSLVDSDRQWFKSHYGLEARETPREIAFCAHAILTDEVLVVEDSSKDQRFHGNPLATDKPNVIFYAGAPLIMRNNLRLGTLCVIGNEPRTISEVQKASLQALARQVVSQFELRLRIKALEQLDSAKDEFISMVSHELRTPLTSINGSLSLLANNKVGILDNKQHKMVQIASRNSERLLGIVNDILVNAQLEAGKLEISRKPQEVIPIIEKAVELNRAYCEKCNCTISFKYDECVHHTMIDCDESRIIQVLTNLISNAAKVSPVNSDIEVCFVVEKNHARIEVIDHGPGIPQEQQQYIFQKFKQIESSGNKKLPGTGLGLRICKQIIELHDGVIGFESRPEEFTKFYITIALSDEQQESV